MSKTPQIVLGVLVLLFVGAFILKTQYLDATVVPTTQTPNDPLPITPENASYLGKWQWVKTEMSDGEVKQPKQSNDFVLTLEANGTLSSTTDCNGLGGKYGVNTSGGFASSDFVSTLMYCEGSMESDYMKDLQLVNSYKISGNQLWLMLPVDSGTMIFEKDQ